MSNHDEKDFPAIWRIDLNSYGVDAEVVNLNDDVSPEAI